jgi:hypothetical protein
MDELLYCAVFTLRLSFIGFGVGCGLNQDIVYVTVSPGYPVDGDAVF